MHPEDTGSPEDNAKLSHAHALKVMLEELGREVFSALVNDVLDPPAEEAPSDPPATVPES